MLRRISRISIVVIAAVALAGCAGVQQSARENPKTARGAVGGAVLGGVIGGIAGGGKYAAIGAIAGALIGGAIGKQMDERDKRLARETAQRAFEANSSGQASTWQNPESGNSGSVTPTRTYQLATGQYCREYQQTIQIGGEDHETYGTACRQSDGTWRIES